MPRTAKRGSPGLVEIERGHRDPGVGDDVPLEAEADAELLGQLVGAVEDARASAAGDEDDPLGAAREGFQPVILGPQGGDPAGRVGVVEAPGERPALFEDGHGPVGDAGEGRGFFEGGKDARPQIKIAADLGGGGPLVPAGVRGDDDVGDGAFPGAAGGEEAG